MNCDVPRAAATATVLAPQRPGALNGARYEPFMMMKVWFAKEPNAVVIVATCPEPAAASRIDCRPAVPGGRSLVSVVIAAPLKTEGFQPVSAPPGMYFL